MKIQIKSLMGSVLFEGDFSSIAAAVTAAIKAGKSLRYADLRYANLSSADLRSADLRSADLRYANLSSANLSYANLSYANLSYANLRSADLRYANLSSADLSSANLSPIKHDFWAVLMYAIREVPALRSALIKGKVNGSAYHGPCACLVGTIANARKVDPSSLAGIIPDVHRPAEMFFLGISTGDTPATNQRSAIAVEWLDEFTKLISQAKRPAAAKRGTSKKKRAAK